jgi:hypothetical protein
MILFILGGLAIALLTDLQISELSALAVTYAAGGAAQSASVVQGNAILYGFSGGFALGELFLFVGVLVFGLAMLNSKVSPNWVAYVGAAAGILSIISIVPAVPFFVLLVGSALGIAWVFIAAAYLVGSGARMRKATASPA